MRKCSWTYRLIFSTYYAIGYCLLVYFVNVWNKKNFNILFGNPIKYPFSLDIAIVAMISIAIVIFFLCLLWPLILSQFKNIIHPFSVFIFDVLLFYTAIGLSLVFFGIDIYFIIDGLIYGIMLGIIDGLKNTDLDLTFLNDRRISEQVKIFKMNTLYDKWFRGLSLFTVFLVSIVIGGGLQWILATPEKVRHITANSIAVVGAYISVGILWGIYWDIFKKINLIDSKILSLKKEDLPDTLPTSG